jgi:hypothetical protein
MIRGCASLIGEEHSPMVKRARLSVSLISASAGPRAGFVKLNARILATGLSEE